MTYNDIQYSAVADFSCHWVLVWDTEGHKREGYTDSINQSSEIFRVA